MKELVFYDSIQEAYLDDNEQFWDYKTSTVNGSDVVDTTKTGMSYYDQFLDKSDSEYLRTEKNLEGKIVKMSPEEYYKICADDIFGVPVSKLKSERERDINTLTKLKTVLQVYKKKLCLPFINYADQQQEGLHRMYVIGELYGWNHEVPVLIIDHADKDRAEKERLAKIEYDNETRVERAIKEAQRYRYSEPSEFIDQMQWELDKVFEYSDHVKTPVEYTGIVKNNTIIINVFNKEFPVDVNSLRIEQPVESDDIDPDLDDIDFLDKYLPDWRTRSEEDQQKLISKLKNESVSSVNIDWDQLESVLESHNHCYYENTSMCLELICEDLYYNVGLDATYKGRSIYVGDMKIATVKVSKDGPDLLGMYDYTIYKHQLKEESNSAKISQSKYPQFIRFTIYDENNHYRGGLFRGLKDLLVQLWNEDSEYYDSLNDPLSWLEYKTRYPDIEKDSKVKFAYTQDFVETYNEYFADIEYTLNELEWTLEYEPVKDIKKIIYQDEDQIAYI